MLPLFRFKPTICWVDDDEIFLNAIRIGFKNKFHCLTFQKSADALAFLSTYRSPLAEIALTKTFTESDLFDIKGHYPIEVDLNAITDLIHYPEKEHDIALVVSDYHMPHMNGAELFKALASLPVKKILLTGAATPENAVEAFNAKLIHQFIKKRHDGSEDLTRCIDQLVDAYFQEKTDTLVHHLETGGTTLLSNPHFANFFNQWCRDNKIVEYFFIKRQASFLTKDAAGKTRYFITMTEMEQQQFLDEYDESEPELKTLFKEVASGKKIPFFGLNKEPWEFHTSEWESHFYSAEPLPLQEGKKAYWVVVEE